MTTTSGTLSAESRIAERSNMRKREMSYSDYGMTGKEVKYVNDICKNPNETEKMIIDTALKEINPYIAPYVKKHLTEKKSYEKLCGEEYIILAKGTSTESADTLWLLLSGG